ncbi:unnamed protein product [Spirodela intermedia]|uniref:Plastid lipid-associated protein/fibrillin conserved domain-containing protein n=1 Tax=Spirodela intermedia TaxID=51605 RepID=A0A7I8IDY7_SPIIN|nr:unnamed protein product [Spirodela intermedia]CAA6655293.1 unnamed protein product [Spirodela intermedia]
MKAETLSLSKYVSSVGNVDEKSHQWLRKKIPRVVLDGSPVLDSSPSYNRTSFERGLAASEDDLRRADEAAKELEAAGGPVDLAGDLDKLQGRWKLVYSSAFSSRTLGAAVFQRIDIVSKDFDNIVELQFGTPWPLPPAEATATLAHKFEVIVSLAEEEFENLMQMRACLAGSSKIRITFEKTTVKATGNLSQLPPLELPRLPDSLRPPSNTGSGEFDVTYADDDLRITRGDREELRVFVVS